MHFINYCIGKAMSIPGSIIQRFSELIYYKTFRRNKKELQLAFEEVLSKGYFYNEVLTRKVMQSIHHGPQENAGILARLTDREMEFLKHACSEKNYQQIAGEMSAKDIADAQRAARDWLRLH